MGQCSLEEAIKKLGVDPSQLRPQQKEIIDSLIDGVNVLGIMPTGFGKSLCFQAPAISSEGTAIVFSPLISLMNDQVLDLKSKGIAAEQWNSTIPAADKKIIKAKLEAGELDLLYLAPEALGGATWKEIKLPFINYIIVDEVHCISQWGLDFRPHYLTIKDFINGISPISVFGCSATIDQYDLKHIVGEIKFPKIVVAKMARPNLRFTVKNCSPKNEEQIVRDALLYKTPMVIFCSSIKKVESLYNALLAKRPNQVGYYHGEAEDDWRHSIQDKFLNNKISIVVATNSFGQGVNKPDIRTVVHSDLPISLTYYVQESGRAGRDGNISNCILYYPKNSMYKIQHYLIDSKNPTRQAIENVFNVLMCKGEFPVMTQRELAEIASVSEYAMPAILAILKKYSILETKTIFKRYYAVEKKKAPPSEPYIKLYNMLVAGEQNLSVVAEKLDWDFDELQDALDDLVQKGCIKYWVTDKRTRRATLFKLKSRTLVSVNWGELEAKRRQHMIRFGDMLSFAESNEKHDFIEKYFSKIKPVG